MPHISVKMLKGRTDKQKKDLSDALVETIVAQLGCSKQHVTCTIEDYDAVAWQDVFKSEITDKPSDKIYKQAEYDPKDLL